MKQSDFDWQDQTGAPSDPQPGNLQGQREILRRELFNDDGGPGGGGGGGQGGNPNAFAADVGEWSVSDGAYHVVPGSGSEESFSVYHADETLPSYYEILVTISSDKARKGLNANGFVIFDYINDQDFKFAGVDLKTNKLIIGHRIADADIDAYIDSMNLGKKQKASEFDLQGWVIDETANLQLNQDGTYDLTIALHGAIATVYVNQSDSTTFVFGDQLNDGLLGLAALGAKAHFDDFQIQRLPAPITLSELDEFSGISGNFSIESGDWTTLLDSYFGDASGGDRSISTRSLDVALYARVWLEATFSTDGVAGLLFDYYGPDDYKFVAIDVANDHVIVGHNAGKGVVVDSTTAVEGGLESGTDYTLGLIMQGGGVNITIDGTAVAAYAFNSILNDGDFGLLVEDGTADFDEALIETDDPAYANAQQALTVQVPAPQRPRNIASLQQSDLAPIVEEAIARLTETFDLEAADIATLEAASITMIDLPGLLLGQTMDDAIIIDLDAAGHGWFIDETPDDDSEFTQPVLGGAGAKPGSAAFGGIDLLSAVMHELAHTIGYDHGQSALDNDYAFMSEMFKPSQRLGIIPDDGQGSSNAANIAKSKTVIFDESRNSFIQAEEAALLRALDDEAWSNHANDRAKQTIAEWELPARDDNGIENSTAQSRLSAIIDSGNPASASEPQGSDNAVDVSPSADVEEWEFPTEWAIKKSKLKSALEPVLENLLVDWTSL